MTLEIINERINDTKEHGKAPKMDILQSLVDAHLFDDSNSLSKEEIMSESFVQLYV